MDSTFNSTYHAAHVTTHRTVSLFNLTAFWDYLEENRFGMTPVFLVFAACLGGFAAAVTVQYSLILLAIVGLSTGLVEVLLIAVAPMRLTFWFLATAVLIDLFVFLF